MKQVLTVYLKKLARGKMKSRKYIPFIVLIAILFSLVLLGPAIPVSAAGSLLLDSYRGSPGRQVAVYGSGFSGSSSYLIRFGTGTNYSRTVAMGTVGVDGSFTAYFVVPDFPGGPYTVSLATDVAENTGSVIFVVAPVISLSSSSGEVGDSLTVSGAGLTASRTFNVYFDDKEIAAAYTDAYGVLSAAVTVPEASQGNHTVKVQDSSGYSASAVFMVIPAEITAMSSITIDPLSGPAGTIITVTGGGFKADKAITITFNGSTIDTSPAVIISDAEGKFIATIAAPESPAGNGIIAAGDGDGTASADFVSSPAVYSTLSGGEVGSSVPISGSGFNAGANIIISFDDVQIATAVSGISGSFSTSVIIPASRSGLRNIGVTDGLYSGVLPFNVTPAVLLTPNSGNVGSEVTVKGYSFMPGGTAVVKYGTVQVAASVADLNGTIITLFEVPPGTGGNQVVTITNGDLIATSVFTLESDPPPVPLPISPGNGVEVGSQSEFQWQSVSDPSGVIYSLQIAGDAGFNNILIDKIGLESPGYMLSAAEKLAPAGAGQLYYWRVRAADRASNASAWSDPQSFSVGAAATAWRWYLVIAVAAVIIFVFGYFLGRRFRSRG